ncbi:MAG: hypothetical protein FWE72_06675 [Spirochaetaceae bacterium]|nr:hypothetical protein [Spirochaetaceae bacterium]
MSNNFEKERSKRHYDREERLAMMPSGSTKDNSKLKGFLRFKPLNIIIINLILICILFPIITFYTRYTANRDFNPDYNFLLNGYIFDNNILVSLTISKKQNSKISDAPLPFDVTISLSDNIDFYKKFFDNMPVSSDKEVVLRTSIPITNYKIHRNTLLYANIVYSDQIISLKSKIKNEK